LLGVLVYVLAWLCQGLWLSLQREQLACAWPDVEAAWTETRFALERAKIDLRDTPLFLILGPLTPDLQALLKSLGMTSMLQRANVPFQVFAQREAVFVVCANLAQLGIQKESQAPHWTGAEPRESSAERLHQLCELLIRDRDLPVQGIVMVLPFAATQSEEGTRSVVNDAQLDLRVIRQATGLEVPLYVAVSGLDLPIRGVLPQAWFQRFPPLPDLDPAEIPTMFQEGVDRLCTDRIIADMRSQFRFDVEPADGGVLNPALSENIKLYQWLSAVQSWRTRLGQVLFEGTQNDFSEPGMVAGCYFLSAGESQASELTQSLWADLLKYQQTTTWTPERIAAYAEQRRRTWLGYGMGLAFSCVAMLGIGGYLLLR
jgi:hypothetical protein